MLTKVVLDGAKMAAVMHGPTGPVARHLIERAEQFKQKARQQARGHYGTNPRSGCLENSIVKRVEFGGAHGIEIRVVSDTSPCSPTHESYSLFVHEGTKPHLIEGNPLLAFHWDHGPDGPGTYFFQRVNHPGTKPNRFFTDNLPMFVR